MELHHFAHLVLSIGDPFTFVPAQEPSPADVIDLVFNQCIVDKIWCAVCWLALHTTRACLFVHFRGADFKVSAFMNRRERILRAISTKVCNSSR
jgi:hypothetical protein